jgi:hypothetical protein
VVPRRGIPGVQREVPERGVRGGLLGSRHAGLLVVCTAVERRGVSPVPGPRAGPGPPGP